MISNIIIFSTTLLLLSIYFAFYRNRTDSRRYVKFDSSACSPSRYERVFPSNPSDPYKSVESKTDLYLHTAFSSRKGSVIYAKAFVGDSSKIPSSPFAKLESHNFLDFCKCDVYSHDEMISFVCNVEEESFGLKLKEIMRKNTLTFNLCFKKNSSSCFLLTDVVVQICHDDDDGYVNNQLTYPWRNSEQDENGIMNKKKNLALCTLIGRTLDLKFVREFIEYHLLVGVEHFFFFFKGPRPHFECFEREVSYYVNLGIVSIEDWNEIKLDPKQIRNVGIHGIFGYQTLMQNDYVHRYQDFFRWIGMIDADEYLTPVLPFQTIIPVLEKYDNFSSVIFEGENVGNMWTEDYDDLFMDAFLERHRANGILRIAAIKLVDIPSRVNLRTTHKIIHGIGESKLLNYQTEAHITHYIERKYIWKSVPRNGRKLDLPISRFFDQVRGNLAERRRVEEEELLGKDVLDASYNNSNCIFLDLSVTEIVVEQKNEVFM